MTIAPLIPAGNAFGGLTGKAPVLGGDLFAAFFSLFQGGGMAKALPQGAGKTDVDLSALLGQNTADAKALTKSLVKQLKAAGKTEDVALEISTLVVELRTTVEELVIAGVNPAGLGGASELALAYQNMGLSPEEARIKAERVEYALDALAVHLGEADGDEEMAEVMPILLDGLLMGNQVEDASTEAQAIRFTRVTQSVKAFAQVIQITPPLDVAERVLARQPLTDMPVAKPVPGDLNKTELPVLDKAISALTRAAETFEAEGLPEAAASLRQKVLEFKEYRESVLTQARPAIAGVAHETFETRDVPPLKRERNTETTLDRARDVAAAIRSGERPQPVEQVRQVSEVAPARPAVSTEETDRGEQPATPRPAPRATTTSQPLVMPEGTPVFRATASDSGDLVAVAAEGEAAAQQDSDAILDDIELDMVGRAREFARPEVATRTAHMARHAEVAEQVNVQLRQLTGKGGGQARITLAPPELGKIEIQVHVADGKVSGIISAQSMEVLEQMARDLRILQQGLAQSGLELGGEGFQFLLQDEGTATADGNSQGGSGHRQTGDGGEDPLETGEAATGWVNPERILDMNV